MLTIATAPSLLTSATPGGPIAPVVRAAHGPVLLSTDGRAPTDTTARVARILADRIGRAVEAVAVLAPLPIPATGPALAARLPDVESGRVEDLHAAVVHHLEPVLGSRRRWGPHDLRVELVRVPYDGDAAVAGVRAAGLPQGFAEFRRVPADRQEAGRRPGRSVTSRRDSLRHLALDAGVPPLH